MFVALGPSFFFGYDTKPVVWGFWAQIGAIYFDILLVVRVGVQMQSGVQDAILEKSCPYCAETDAMHTVWYRLSTAVHVSKYSLVYCKHARYLSWRQQFNSSKEWSFHQFSAARQEIVARR
jgi:hypothetical protein